MKIEGYRVFKCLTDNKGNIVHKTPVGFSRTEKGARALRAGCSGLMPVIIEPIYAEAKEYK